MCCFSQVFKFACYVSIPVGMTYLIAGKPHVLEAIIKNVSYLLLEHYRYCTMLLHATNCTALCRGPTWCTLRKGKGPHLLKNSLSC